MSRKARLLPFVGALVLSSTAMAASQTMVRTIDVSIDLEAVTNAAAAQRFATLDADLQTALMTRLVDRIDPEDGVNIEIDLSEVELSNFFDQAYDTAENKLVGQVNVSHPTDNTDFNSYELAIAVHDVTPIAAAVEGRLTPAESSDKYYDAMIAAFADAVVERLGD